MFTPLKATKFINFFFPSCDGKGERKIGKVEVFKGFESSPILASDRKLWKQSPSTTKLFFIFPSSSSFVLHCNLCSLTCYYDILIEDKSWIIKLNGLLWSWLLSSSILIAFRLSTSWVWFQIYEVVIRCNLCHIFYWIITAAPHSLVVTAVLFCSCSRSLVMSLILCHELSQISFSLNLLLWHHPLRFHTLAKLIATAVPAAFILN